jgi:hypothetical protein
MMQPTSDHQYHYVALRTHNGAAILSVVCAILWPLTLTAILYVNSVANTSGPGGSASPAPEPLSTLLSCGFSLLPLAGVFAGGIGLYRAIRQRRLRRSLWLALTGLLFGCLWFIAAYIVIG